MMEGISTEPVKHSLAATLFKRVVAGYLIGLGFAVVSMMTFAHNLLLLPSEWFAGLEIRRVAGQGVRIYTQSGLIEAGSVEVLCISVVGLGIILFLASFYCWVESSVKAKSVLVGLLSLATVAIIFYPTIQLISMPLSGVVDVQPLGLTLLGLNLALFVKIYSKGRFLLSRPIMPLFGYLLTVAIAFAVPYFSSGSGTGLFFAELLIAPLAWMNVAFFFDNKLLELKVPKLWRFGPDKEVQHAARWNLVINVVFVFISVLISRLI